MALLAYSPGSIDWPYLDKDSAASSVPGWNGYATDTNSATAFPCAGSSTARWPKTDRSDVRAPKCVSLVQLHPADDFTAVIIDDARWEYDEDTETYRPTGGRRSVATCLQRCVPTFPACDQPNTWDVIPLIHRDDSGSPQRPSTVAGRPR